MGYKIAVVGVTGRVAREVLSILAEFQDDKKILILLLHLHQKNQRGKR